MPIPSDIPLTTIDGKAETLGAFDGQALLIVNTASQCGFTPQYKGLEALHRGTGRPRLRGAGLPLQPVRRAGARRRGRDRPVSAR